MRDYRLSESLFIVMKLHKNTHKKLTFYEIHIFQIIFTLKLRENQSINLKLCSKFEVEITKKALSVRFSLGAVLNFPLVSHSFLMQCSFVYSFVPIECF